MAIVKMNKFNLLIFKSEREELLKELQKFDSVHFLDLVEDEELSEYDLDSVDQPESIVAINEEINKVKNAIDFLDKYSEKKSALLALKEGKTTLEFSELENRASQTNYKAICNLVFKINSELEKISGDIINLNSKIKEISPWINLDVPIKDTKSFKHVELILGLFPKRFEENIQDNLVTAKHTHFEILREYDGNFYALVITNDKDIELVKEAFRKNNFYETSPNIDGIPKEELNKLEAELKSKQNQIADYENELKELSKDILDLQIVYEYLLNVKLRITASENFLATDSVDIIEGYVPTEKSEDFTNVINNTLDNKIYHYQIEEADKDDPNVPILLENSKYTSSFESLTTMYAYPRYNEIDPTPYNAPFYSFFFGMMVADVGYGLVLLLGTFILLKLFNLSEEEKGTIRFFYVQSFFVILWGIIYGSFFSFSIPTRILDPGTQYMEVLLISIGFGIIHIYAGLGINAYMHIKNGKPLEALYDAGFWYMALTGGIILIAGSQLEIPSLVSDISLYVMIIGMVGILLTGGRESPSVGGKLGGGLYSLYGISSYIGDFISYSRLMALGLSGGYLASAITDMSFMLFETNIIGIIFGIVVFIFGHTFNIFLSLLSAYVHDIRLTYVEFFGKYYEGGGKAFKTLRNKAKYINIK